MSKKSAEIFLNTVFKTEMFYANKGNKTYDKLS